MGQMQPGADASAVGVEISTALQGGDPSRTVRVESARELITALSAQHAVQTRLLAAIGSISLLVGGIGVMNVMLISMLERRREIGLRSAIGAPPWAIQAAFLIEAAVLSLAGGLLGCGLGVASALVVASRSGWAFHIPLYAVPLSSGIAVAIGVVFGAYPALKA